MRIHIRNDKVNLKMYQHIVYGLKCIARDAMEYVKCGTNKAICGTFTCSQEVPISNNKIKGGEDSAI